jgi:predicted transcriptional regulator
VEEDCMRKDLDSIILTKNEIKIMAAVWDKGEDTVGDVFNTIS